MLPVVPMEEDGENTENTPNWSFQSLTSINRKNKSEIPFSSIRLVKYSEPDY